MTSDQPFPACGWAGKSQSLVVPVSADNRQLCLSHRIIRRSAAATGYSGLLGLVTGSQPENQGPKYRAACAYRRRPWHRQLHPLGSYVIDRETEASKGRWIFPLLLGERMEIRPTFLTARAHSCPDLKLIPLNPSTLPDPP